MHLVGPVQAALPALAGKLLGRRGERVGHRIPDVGAAVAVEIDRVFQIVRRQKLRQPHRAGPRAFHVGEPDLSVLSDFQRQQEFLAEFVLALAQIGLRRQHADRAARILGAAVIGFAAEDREHDGRIDAELPLDGAERRPVLIVELAAGGREPADRALLDIVRRQSARIRAARPAAVPAGPE